MTPGDPRALLTSAQSLEKAGNLVAAEAVYVQLLSEHPELADTWFNLALLQRRIGRFEVSLQSYQQALDRGAQQPEEIHLNRAVIYTDCLRRDDAAEIELQTALSLNSTYIPALLNLANLREDYGRRDDACLLYEKILAIDPAHVEALARYTSLLTFRCADDPLIVRLRNTITDARCSLADKASLGFSLGKCLDACADFDQAFDAYATANRHSRASAAEPLIYDRDQHEKFVSALIDAFPHGQAGSPSSTTATDVKPVFICGMFRSGSTLTEQVLCEHSSVTSGGELSFLPNVATHILSPFPQSMARVTQPQIESLSSGYLSQLSKLYPGAPLVTDKRPDNFLYIGLIKRLFPAARIIHTRRNALDNCLSVFFLHLDHRMRYAMDLLDTAHYYVHQQRLMDHWKGLYAEDILTFDYDEFVREPRPAVAKLLSFCQLDWEENCLAARRTRQAVKTASVWQVREPIYQRSSGRWRRYETHLVELRSYLREHLAGFEG